jgi:hypothetical protein
MVDITGKVKAIPLQACPGPFWFQGVEAPRFQDNRHMNVAGFQPYAPAAFTPRKYSSYLLLLEAESTPGPQCGRKYYVNEELQWHHRESNPRMEDVLYYIHLIWVTIARSRELQNSAASLDDFEADIQTRDTWKRTWNSNHSDFGFL